MTGEWRSLHNEDTHRLYDSADIVRVLKSQRLRWACRKAETGHRVCAWDPTGPGDPEGRAEFLFFPYHTLLRLKCFLLWGDQDRVLPPEHEK